MKTTSFPVSNEAAIVARRCGITPERYEVLARDLCATADALWRRKASSVPAGHLDAYLALQWLRWRAGALELTDAGRSIREAAA